MARAKKKAPPKAGAETAAQKKAREDAEAAAALPKAGAKAPAAGGAMTLTAATLKLIQEGLRGQIDVAVKKAIRTSQAGSVKGKGGKGEKAKAETSSDDEDADGSDDESSKDASKRASSSSSSSSSSSDGDEQTVAFAGMSRKKLLKCKPEKLNEVDIDTIAEVRQCWMPYVSAAGDAEEQRTRASRLLEKVSDKLLTTSAGPAVMGSAYYEVPFLKRALSLLLHPRTDTQRVSLMVDLLGTRILYAKVAADQGVKAAARYWKHKSHLSLLDKDVRKVLHKDGAGKKSKKKSKSKSKSKPKGGGGGKRSRKKGKKSG
jgi:hypothetical protein